MFRDEEDLIKMEIGEQIRLYGLEDLLDEMEITPEEAIYYLIINGLVVLPERKPL